MKKIPAVSLFLCLLLSSTRCIAQDMFAYSSIDADVAASDIVVVAQIVHMPPMIMVPTYRNDQIQYMPFTISCRALRAFKGSLSSFDLTVNVPQSDILFIPTYANVDGTYALFALKAEPDGSWQTASKSFVFVPLGSQEPELPKIMSSDPLTATLEALVSAAKDKTWRSSLLNTLASQNNPVIPVGVQLYLDDPDPKVRKAALTCMAECDNQSGIAPMVKLLESDTSVGDFSWDFEIFKGFASKADVPLLLPLTWSRYPNVRESALWCVFHINSPDALPFVIPALLDTDRSPLGKTVTYSYLEYWLQSDVQVRNGPTDADFEATRDDCYNEFASWWTNQLAAGTAASPGKSELKDIQDAIGANDPIASALSSSDTWMREQECAALVHADDDNNVGYLLVCLLDPDERVSYPAYLCLRTHADKDPGARVLEGNLPTAEIYCSNASTYNAAVYKWWRDRLSHYGVQW